MVALLAALLLSADASYLDIVALRKDIEAAASADDALIATLFCFQHPLLRIQCRLGVARDFLESLKAKCHGISCIDL